VPGFLYHLSARTVASYTKKPETKTLGRYLNPNWLLNAGYCLATFCLFDSRPFLAASVVKLTIALVFACLLSFVALHSSTIGDLVIACLHALPKALFPFHIGRRWTRRSETTFAIIHEPSLSPLFQRPPPYHCW
jgi:hypothetical protein